MRSASILVSLLAGLFVFAFRVAAEERPSDLASLQGQIDRERMSVEAQSHALELQRKRLDALEAALLDQMRGRGLQRDASREPASQASDASDGQRPPVQVVGEAPDNPPDAPDVAVLADQGGVTTEQRRFSVESSVEYARADRSRVVFRGIEVPQSVLVGVFDINESRQDVLTAAVTARLGLTPRFELNARVPYVYRSDASVLSPVSASPDNSDSAIGSRDFSVTGAGIGDVELGARYQLNTGANGRPLLIAGLQVLTPSGTNPFEVPRDDIGNARKSATGAGFWGVAPTITALLPSDPAVLFGTLGYTYNFGRNINRAIGDTTIERVRPGGEPSIGVGIGLALNSRTSVSFGYAHTMSFGTETRTRVLDRTQPVPTLSDPIESTSRDLQLGRFLLGVSHRLDEIATLNWNLEVGATDDAADVRTTLRVPFNFAAHR
jgi:hypothetical protein